MNPNIFIKKTSRLKSESLEGFCQCCLSENNLKSMLLSHDGKDECKDYAEMINTCFSKNLIGDMNQNDVLYLICDLCILKLEESFSFRKLIEEVQIKLKNTIYSAHAPKAKEISIKRENYVPIPQPLKFPSSPSGNFDFGNEEDLLLMTNFESTPKAPSKNEIRVKKIKEITKCEIIHGKIDESVVVYRPGKGCYKNHAINTNNKLMTGCKIVHGGVDESQVLRPGLNNKIIEQYFKIPIKTNCENIIPEKLFTIKILKQLKAKKTLTKFLDSKSTENIQQCKPKNDDDGLKTLKSGKNEIKIPKYILDRDTVSCDRCMKTFDSHRELVSHAPTHFPNFVCDICGKAFLFSYGLKNHLGIHVKEKLTCEICGMKLVPRYMLKHMKKHSGEIDFLTCPYCPDRFTSFSSKLKHLLDVHGVQRKRYQCKICPKNYSLPHHRTAHVRKYHLQERNHECTECGKRFFTSTWLKEHMMRHRGDRRFHCDMCYKSFYKKYDLAKHVNTHSELNKVKCSICNESFEKIALRVHLKKHKKGNKKVNH